MHRGCFPVFQKCSTAPFPGQPRPPEIFPRCRAFAMPQVTPGQGPVPRTPPAFAPAGWGLQAGAFCPPAGEKTGRGIFQPLPAWCEVRQPHFPSSGDHSRDGTSLSSILPVAQADHRCSHAQVCGPAFDSDPPSASQSDPDPRRRPPNTGRQSRPPWRLPLSAARRSAK